MKLKTITILAAVVLVLPAMHAQQPGQSYAGCQLFPTDSVFHARVDSLPVSADPAMQIPTADLTVGLHPVFGDAAVGGYFVNVVSSTQATVPVQAVGGQNYYQAAPIPANAELEGEVTNCSSGGDCHLIVLQQAATAGGACTLYEAYGATPSTTVTSGWTTKGQNMVADLGGYKMPPQDNDGVNAAQTYILPYLVTSADLAAGVIQHTIAISVPSPPKMLNNYFWPATGFGGTGSCTGGYQDADHMLLWNQPPTSCPTNGPAAGTVWRRKASASPLPCVTAGTCPQTAMIEKAAAQYGLIAVDNGGNFLGVLGEFSPNWNDTDLHNLTLDSATNYEPVDIGSLAADLTPSLGNPAILAPSTTYKVNAPTSGGTPVAVTATYNGVTLTATVTVNPGQVAPSLQSISITPATITVGQSATVTIALSGPAPTGGATVTLASNSTHFPIPGSPLVIAAGSTSGSVAVIAQ